MSQKSLRASNGLKRHCVLKMELMKDCIMITTVKFRIIKPKRVEFKISHCYVENFLQIILLHLFPELTTISFLCSASRKRKYEQSVGELILREKSTRKTMIHWIKFNCTNISLESKRELKTEEKIVSW